MSEQSPPAPQTHLEKIQTGIIDLLKSGLSARYLIDGFPDDPSNYDMADASKIALIQYSGSRYAAPDGSIGNAQNRRPEFAIHLYLRRLGGPLNGLGEIEKIRLCLQGQIIEGATLEMLRDGLVDQDDAHWRYLIEIGCEVPSVTRQRPRPSPIFTDFSKPEDA